MRYRLLINCSRSRISHEQCLRTRSQKSSAESVIALACSRAQLIVLTDQSQNSIIQCISHTSIRAGTNFPDAYVYFSSFPPRKNTVNIRSSPVTRVRIVNCVSRCTRVDGGIYMVTLRSWQQRASS